MRRRWYGVLALVSAITLLQCILLLPLAGKGTSCAHPAVKELWGSTSDGGDDMQPGQAALRPHVKAGLSSNTACTGMEQVSEGIFDNTNFRVTAPTYHILDGSRATPMVIDGIDLGGLGLYNWGIAYDWDRDALWVTDYLYGTLYQIAKTSPLTILGSVAVSGIVPLYYLGIAYAGSDIIYMCGYDGSIYQINVSTGVGALYRTSPWTGEQGLGWSVADDAAYPGDWTMDQCAYAIPSLTGIWNTWSRIDVSGLAASYDATTSPAWLWVVDELSPQAYLYQYALTAGVPSALPTVTWELPAGMTMLSTADCAYDGQYVYVLDQSLNTDSIWVLDPTLLNKDAEVVSIDYPNIDCFVLTPAVPVTVQATIQNNGASTETFNVSCAIDSAGTIIYSDIQPVTLNSTQSTQVNFAPQWDAPVEDVNYYVSVKTELTGDENPANDSLCMRAKAVTWTDEITYDDGVMANAWRWLEPYSYDSIIAKKFEPPYYPCYLKYAAVYLLSESDAYWPWPDATHDPVELTVWTDTDGDDVPDNLAFRDTVTGDTAPPSWVYVVPFDTLELWSYNFWVGMNNVPGGGEEGIGLDAATDFPINKYTGSYSGVWHTQAEQIGDEMVRAYVSMGALEHDVGLMSIDTPSGNTITPDVALTPEVTVHNYGDNVESFLVTCYIDSCSSNKYTDTQIVNNLGIGSSTPVTFPSWTPSANNGIPYRFRFVADLTGDQIPQNDTLLKWAITGQAPTRNYLLIQNYWSWYPITGWASIDSVCSKNGIPLTIYPDDSIGSCDLSAFSKVILPSDQDQAFYDSVQNHIDWFKFYVQQGGILQVDCADHGSGYMGEWDTLRLLPCDYEYRFSTNDEARRNTNCHEILLVPNEIGDAELGVWTYVSHGYLKTVSPPDVDTIIRNMESPLNSPCLTVDDYFNAKDGRAGGVVIYTTMTVEWAWAYGYSRLLENLILYPNWEPINVGIELTGFSASVVNGALCLKWQTSSEIGNAAWHIDRREIGGAWSCIASVPSGGNSPSGNSYSFTDRDIEFGKTYHYRLGSVDEKGEIVWQGMIEINPATLGMPRTFALAQNYPNPFVHQTLLKYQVPRKERVTITLYDVTGREITQLTDGIHDPGFYEITWDGRERNGEKAGQGVYFCRMEAGDFTKTRRLIRY